jgi:Asp-tRNA(Asn)/Glu-tRNA(Gln) amidotransferase A subunit family amidase
MGDGRTVIGPLARSIDDLELVLAVIAGADGLDGAAPPVPPPPLPSPRIDVGNGVRGRRAAVVTAGLEGGRVLPTIKKAVERAGAALEAAGMELVEWPWPAWLAEALDVTERYWRRSQGQLDAADADRHLIDWDRFRARYLRVMADVDIVVLPTVAETAPAEREITGEDFVFDLPAALAGAPALSVPAGWDGQGLPLAVQLSGRPWEDALVLAAGRVVADPG